MIKSKKGHECDMKGCDHWSMSELDRCAICDGEFCDAHLRDHLILTTRNVDHHKAPLAAFPAMCHKCVDNFKLLTPRAFARALMEAMKYPANLKG